MRQVTVAALAAVLLAAAPAMAAPRTFAIDTDKHSPNEVSFTSKAAIVKFTGRTAKLSGEAKVDVDNVAKSSGTLSIPLADLDTGIAMRNEHMIATIDAGKFPMATFKFTDIKVPGNKLKTDAPVVGTATGTMTLHGVTKSVVLDARFYGAGVNGMSKAQTVGFSATAKLKRSNFGLGYAAPAVSDEVSLDIAAAFEKAPG